MHGLTLLGDALPLQVADTELADVGPFRVQLRILGTSETDKGERIWQFTHQGERSYSHYYLNRLAEAYTLTVDSHSQCGFRYTSDAIEILQSSVDHAWFDQLNGIGLAVWLEMRGVPCIHATVLSIEGRAVGLVGRSGVGKSTLAAALLSRGASFLSEDMLALHELDGRPAAFPGLQSLQLWPDALDALDMPAAHHWQRVVPGFEKRLIPVSHFEAGCGGNAPVILDSLFLLDRAQKGVQPAISGLGFIDASMMLVIHSSSLDIPRVLRLEQQRFERCAGIVRGIFCKKLTFPTDLSCVDRLCALIEAEVSQSGASVVSPAQQAAR
ncbi:MAG: hypothetical protein AAGI44_18955 [Pseudomonadota bacterium]